MPTNRSILIILFLVLGHVLTFGQQEPHFTQFMQNKVLFNPGAAGVTGGPAFTAVYRNQWLGLEGSPQTQLLNFQTQSKTSRTGWGASIVHQSIGIQENWTMEGIYAYRIKTSGGNFSFGLNASIRYYGIDFTDSRIITTQPKELDPSIPGADVQKYVPNFGAGVFYQGSRFFLGLSAPRLLQNNLNFEEQKSVDSKEISHLFLMTGVIFPMNPDAKLCPQTLIKYVKGAPLDVDINVSLLLKEKFNFGVSYRLGGARNDSVGESLALLSGFQLNTHLMAGISYDFSLTDLRKYNSGSLELMLRYFLKQSENQEFINPRFF